MSIRARTREVAVLRTLGFTRGKTLRLLLGESIAVALLGGTVGIIFGTLLIRAMSRPGIGLPVSMHMTLMTAGVVMSVAALVGLVSAVIPSYRASHLGIVDGLRHIG
jgi:putative ABC transport system permease protein